MEDEDYPCAYDITLVRVKQVMQQKSGLLIFFEPKDPDGVLKVHVHLDNTRAVAN
jgi:hypothetical protein